MVIDKRSNPYDINLNISIPHNDKEIVESFMEDMRELNDKWRGSPMKSHIIMDMRYDIERILSKEKYRGIMVDNDEFYYSEYWSLDKLLSVYKEHYPDRFESDKVVYSNIEVNNILFDLHIANVIGNYHSPAVCFDLPSHNDKVFEGDVYVEVPFIKFGSRSEHEFVAGLYFLDKPNRP